MYEKEYANFEIPVLLKESSGSKKKKFLLSWKLVVVKSAIQTQLNGNTLHSIITHNVSQEQISWIPQN